MVTLPYALPDAVVRTGGKQRHQRFRRETIEDRYPFAGASGGA